MKTDLPFEAERYELLEKPVYRFALPRREFFKRVGGGLIVVSLIPTAAAQESGGGRRGFRGGRRPQELGAWLHIGEDGLISVFTGKAEVGQNIRTSLTQVVAEELRTPVPSIRLVMADTDLTPFDAGTFGSRTTPDMAAQLRRVGAAAREILLDLAASSLTQKREELVVADGRVSSKDGKASATFAELTKGEKILKPIPASPPITPAESWKIAGTSFRKISGRELVTGKQTYSPDIRRPGMLYGKVLRPAAFRATLESLDSSTVESLPEIKLVRDGSFIGVTAPTDVAAARALALLKPVWKTEPQISDKELFDHLKKGRRAERPAHAAGSMESGLAAADQKLETTYTVAYIAHTPLEPRAALAEWNGDRLTVWTGSQRPFGVRGELAQAFRIPEERIRVIVPDTGSGYGGKHTGEAAVEAARLAKAAGKPVKLVWTRREEFTWAYFRPAGVIEIRSGATRDGKITAWEFHNFNSGGSAIRPLYDIPNQLIEFHSADSPLRQGSYRGLAATANHFARESHMDELAHALKMDPLEFRLRNLQDPRLRAVLQAAAKNFDWANAKSTKERGFGLACGFEKGGYVATCAEVHIDRSTGALRVARVSQAFECGAILNPDQLKNQNEGAIIMGLGGALYEAIHFENGKIANPRLSEYRVPRFSDLPEIQIVLLDRKDLSSSGAGETPIVGIAPAVANAIFAATGRRLRGLPMAPSGKLEGV